MRVYDQHIQRPREAVGHKGPSKVNQLRCKTEVPINVYRIKLKNWIAILIPPSVYEDGLEKALPFPMKVGGSKRQVKTTATGHLQKGWYFERRTDSSCSTPSETASATVVTVVLWVCTILLIAEPPLTLSSQAIWIACEYRGFAGGAYSLPIKTGLPDFFNHTLHLLEPGE